MYLGSGLSNIQTSARRKRYLANKTLQQSKVIEEEIKQDDPERPKSTNRLSNSKSINTHVDPEEANTLAESEEHLAKSGE